MPAEVPPDCASIDADFIAYWSRRYPLGNAETRLFEEVGPSVADRGYYLRDELVRVCRWKSPRSASYVGRNSDEDIEDVSRLAFRAPERLRHRVLGLLGGVGTPMASALLTVAFPGRFTVIDYRALETLRAHGESDEGWPTYGDYLAVCRRLAGADTTLRSLDRALWQWSKEQAA